MHSFIYHLSHRTLKDLQVKIVVFIKFVSGDFISQLLDHLSDHMTVDDIIELAAGEPIYWRFA